MRGSPRHRSDLARAAVAGFLVSALILALGYWASTAMRSPADAGHAGSRSPLSLTLPAAERAAAASATATPTAPVPRADRRQRAQTPTSTTTSATADPASASSGSRATPGGRPTASTGGADADALGGDADDSFDTPALTTTPTTTDPQTTAPQTTGTTQVPVPVGPSGVAPSAAPPVRLRLDDMAFAPASASADGSLRLVFAVSGGAADSSLPPTVAVRLAVPAVAAGKALKLSVELNHDDPDAPTLAVRVVIVDAPTSTATVAESAAATAATSNTLDIVTPLDVPTTSAPEPSEPVTSASDEPDPVQVTLPVADDGVAPDQSVLVPTSREATLPITVGSDQPGDDPDPAPAANVQSADAVTGAAGADRP